MVGLPVLFYVVGFDLSGAIQLNYFSLSSYRYFFETGGEVLSLFVFCVTVRVTFSTTTT